MSFRVAGSTERLVLADGPVVVVDEDLIEERFVVKEGTASSRRRAPFHRMHVDLVRLRREIVLIAGEPSPIAVTEFAALLERGDLRRELLELAQTGAREPVELQNDAP